MAERRPIVLIGNRLHELTDIDTIPNYYNKTDIDLLLSNVSAGAIDTDLIMSKLPVYNKTTIDTEMAKKANKLDFYTNTEIAQMLSKKISAGTVYLKDETYSKSEIYSKNETYSKIQLYSKLEIDTLFSNFGALSADDIFTKDEVNAMFSNIPNMSNVVTTSILTTTKNQILSTVESMYLKNNNTYITLGYANDNFLTLDNTYSREEIDNKITDLDIGLYAKTDWVNSKILDILTGAGAITIDLSNYYTKSQVVQQIEDALDGASLTDYFDKTETTTAINTAVSNLYSKTEIDTKISNISLSSYYTKTEIDSKISEIDIGAQVDLSNYYIKTEIDSKISNISLSNYYTKTEIDLALSNINLTNYYTKSQMTLELAKYAQVGDSYNKIDSDLRYALKGSGGTVDLSEYSTTSEIELILSSYSKVGDSFSKTDSDLRYSQKNDVYTKSTTYNKTEVDTLLTVRDNKILAVETKIPTIESKIATLESGASNNADLELNMFKLDKKFVRFTDTIIADLKLEPVLTQLPLISVTDTTVKTYNAVYNPKYVQVYLNRNLLYTDEYTATNGTSITFLIDLYKSDKIKVVTSTIDVTFTIDYTDIDNITVIS